MGKRWTRLSATEVERLYALHDLELPVIAIAKSLGISRRAVYKRLHKRVTLVQR